MVTGKETQRTIGPDGQVTGTYLNSIIYDVEFPDGQVKEYAANIIAENILTQVDSDGMSTTLMEAIVDHQRDDEKALQHHDKYVQTKNGRCHLRKTTKGWELLIKWKDKSESWIKLAEAWCYGSCDITKIMLKTLCHVSKTALKNGGSYHSEIFHISHRFHPPPPHTSFICFQHGR